MPRAGVFRVLAWSVLLLTVPGICGACGWRVNIGAQSTNPKEIPAGKQQQSYIVQTSGEQGRRSVIGALKTAFSGSADVSTLRELRGLGNMFTAQLSGNAVRWLCDRAELNAIIIGMEVDQAVTAFAGGNR